MATRLGFKKDVDAYVAMMRRAGVTVVRSNGTVIATHNRKVIFRALEKGPGQPWIMSFIDSELITWNFDE